MWKIYTFLILWSWRILWDLSADMFYGVGVRRHLYMYFDYGSQWHCQTVHLPAVWFTLPVKTKRKTIFIFFLPYATLPTALIQLNTCAVRSRRHLPGPDCTCTELFKYFKHWGLSEIFSVAQRFQKVTFDFLTRKVRNFLNYWLYIPISGSDDLYFQNIDYSEMIAM